MNAVNKMMLFQNKTAASASKNSYSGRDLVTKASEELRKWGINPESKVGQELVNMSFRAYRQDLGKEELA